MKREFVYKIKDIYTALEVAASDLYGFSVICHDGSAMAAEPQLLEVLLIGLEKGWFVEGENGELDHQEFREEFFRLLWQKSVGKKITVMVGTDVPLGHSEMPFYKIPLRPRAALFLRTKKHLTFEMLASILGLDSSIIEEEIESAREILLGRRIYATGLAEEDF